MKPRSDLRATGRRAAGAAAVAALLLLGSAAARAQPPVEFEGDYLNGRNGMSLYIYDQDPVGTRASMCKGPCTTIWPPLSASVGDRDSGDFTVIERDDGSLQWAYKGKPLYFYARDPGPNARAGTDANRAWHPARR